MLMFVKTHDSRIRELAGRQGVAEADIDPSTVGVHNEYSDES